MKILLVVTLVLVMLLALPRLLARNAGPSHSDGGAVTVADFQSLIHSLESAKSNGSFWVVLVPETSRTDGLAANLQFSIEDDEIGIDWVLNSEANAALQEEFSKIASSVGLQPRKKTGNGVEYIRVTGMSDPAKFGQLVIEEMFHNESEFKMQLIVSGFSWPEP